MKIAIIGCGAVTEVLHLPCLARSSEADVMLLVDRSLERARELAAGFGVEEVAQSALEKADLFEAAIVAVPHFLHAPISCELLRAGKHVLVEKPMALSKAECEEMILAAQEGGVSIAVGQMRRFTPALSLAKEILDRGWLGEIRKVDAREGGVFNWPVVSDFQFRKEAAGGGVLFDTGAHVIDTLVWWFGTPEVLAYRDDAMGGVEADCEVELRFGDGTPAFVELSRTRALRGSVIVEGSKGRMEVFPGEDKIELSGVDSRNSIRSVVASHGGDLGHDSFWPYMFDQQLSDWMKSIKEGVPARASGEDAMRTVECIATCYEQRRELTLPWMNFKA